MIRGFSADGEFVCFELQPGEPIRVGLTRSFAAQAKKACHEIENLAADEAIHDARKRLKRLRALVRLVWEPLGRRRYQEINVALRDAGKPLAEARDAEVLVQTVSQLIETPPDGVGKEDLESIRSVLIVQRNLSHSEVIGHQRLTDRLIKLVKAARRRLEHWDAAECGWDVVSDGLKETYNRARSAMNAAAADPGMLALHEWRKQDKYLWHQVEFLTPLVRESESALSDSLHQLADYLGDDHDLAVLAGKLLDCAEEWNVDGAVVPLLNHIRHRRGELQSKAFELGRQLFDDSADEFAERFDHVAWAAVAEAGATGR